MQHHDITKTFRDQAQHDCVRGMLRMPPLRPPEQKPVVVEYRDAFSDHRFFHDGAGNVITCCRDYHARELLERGYKEATHLHVGATDGINALPPALQGATSPTTGVTAAVDLAKVPAPKNPTFPRCPDGRLPKLFRRAGADGVQETLAASLVRAVEEKVVDEEAAKVYSPYHMYTKEIVADATSNARKENGRLSNYWKCYCCIRGLMTDQDPKHIKLGVKPMLEKASAAGAQVTLFGGPGGMLAPSKSTQHTWRDLAAFLVDQQKTA